MDLSKVLVKHQAGLMARDDVVGLCESELPDGRPCLLVLLADGTGGGDLPAVLEGYPVAVQVSGVIRPVAAGALAEQVLAATSKLSKTVSRMKFSEPVTHVYNPLEYAWALHAAYVHKWGATRRRVLMLGMNPGPWGMAQTGVPFGEVSMVKEFLGLSGQVKRPRSEHPKRPVLGLESTRSEVSGRRLWGFFGEKFDGPDGFFAEHFVVNYCPLVFMEEGARNRTPDKLPVGESGPLFAACDARLRTLVDLYRPEWVIGVGGFARKKLDALFGPKSSPRGEYCPGKIGTVLHPSPASPAANRGWAVAAERQMMDQGVWV